MKRRVSRKVSVGSRVIGGGSPILVQTMCNVPSKNFTGTIEQMRHLRDMGCDIIRLAVPDMESAGIFSAVKAEGIDMPVVADIHFDYRIALESLKNGADKIRINPGNIGEKWKVREVAEACSAKGVPIRIGVNSGSLDKKILEKYGKACADALVESALAEAESLERFGFRDIVISVKSSDVNETVKALRKLSSECDYPLHLGITEAGDAYSGLVKNAIGIGSLLLDGIGDTIRVSLTSDPAEEIRAGREILDSLGLNPKGTINIISCPTCGRTCVDLIRIAAEIKDALRDVDPKGRNINVAVMGCAVNGPGEAREADLGIAGGNGDFLFFKKGEPVCRISEEEAAGLLRKEIGKLTETD